MAANLSPQRHLANLTEVAKIYAACGRETSLQLIKNWIIIPASLLAFLAFSLALTILSQLNTGLVGGFIAGLIQIALLTLYYYWISETAARQKLAWRDLITFEYSLFSSIINVGFVFFIAQFLIEGMTHGMTSFPIMTVVSLAIIIIFNPVAEVIQQRRGDGLGSLQEAYTFTLENWIEWFGPFVLMLLPWIWISPAGPLSALSQTNPLLPAAPLVWGSQQVIFHLGGYSAATPALLVGLVLANWFMIFRALLFRQLSSSSRRKRAYQFKNS